MPLPSRRILERLYELAIGSNLYPPEGVYTRPAIGPAPYYDKFGRQFVWDLPFSGITVARIGGRPDLVKGFIENFVDLRVTDGPDTGMFPRHIHVEGHMAGQDGSQAPMLCWLTSEVNKLAPDDDFVRRVYPALADYIRWYRGPRRDYDQDGLSEYAGSTPTFAVYESGHDFGPEHDLVMNEPTAASSDGLVHQPIADVTLNSYLFMEMNRLAELSEVAAPAESAEWLASADALKARMNESMWDEEKGAFFSCIRRDLVASQPRHHRITPAILMPLWAGIASRDQAERTIRLLREEPQGYPAYDGVMEIRLSSRERLYHGYQVVTDSLYPSARPGAGAAGVEAGEVDMTAAGWTLGRHAKGDAVLACGWDHGRHVPTVHFAKLVIEVDVVDDNDGGVEVSLPGAGGDGVVLRAQKEGLGGVRTFMLDPTPGFRRRGVDRLTELVVRDPGPTRADLTVSAVRLKWWRIDRRGLLSPYGIKSAHPLDGKHPAPGAPTHFWSGTIWGPHQLHGCQALARYGEEALAEAIADAYMQTQVRSFAAGGDAYEHHSFHDGTGLGTGRYTWGVGCAMVLYDELVEPGSLSGENSLGRGLKI